MGRFHDHHYPGESEAYRAARDELLEAEIGLRRQIAALAERRRKLPPGGKLKEDYVFTEGAPYLADRTTVKETRFSELFDDGRDTLLVYSFMYPPEADNPCPACTSLLDGLNANAGFVRQRVSFAVVARADIEKVRDFARSRGWHNLRLLSSAENNYNVDYFGEQSLAAQMPVMNVFRRDANGIHHHNGSELLFAEAEKGQHPRHVDLMWPMWNMLDLTPEGRGDWFPKVFDA